MKHSSTQWLRLERAVSRVLQQFVSLKRYCLQQLCIREQNVGELEEVNGDSLQVNNVQSRSKLSHEVSSNKKQLLHSVCESAGDHLSTTEKAQFYDLLLSYADIVAGNDEDIGHTSKLKYGIHTGDAKPIRQPTRRLPPHQKDKVDC